MTPPLFSLIKRKGLLRMPKRYSEEDQKLAEENRAAREHYCDDGLRRLMAAVCLLAIKDYEGGMRTGQRKQIEEFFGSDMFANMTGMSDKEEVIRHLNERRKQKA